MRAMELRQIAELVMDRLFGRLMRRSIGATLLALFTLVAAGYFTVAGTLVLQGLYGLRNACLIVAGIYFVAASIVLIVLWATRTRSPIKDHAAAAMSARDAQIAALIEAAVFGYAVARKFGDRAH
jgi:hypothetical protein